jgi:hypothetical protein
MAFMLKNLPEDVIFHQIQKFIGKEKQIYYNKYVKEYRIKITDINTVYNKIRKLFDNCSITYNKASGGSVLEMGWLGDKWCLGLNGSNKYAITHIIYSHNPNVMVAHTELCMRKEYFYEYYDDIDDYTFRDVPDMIKYNTFYNYSTKL